MKIIAGMKISDNKAIRTIFSEQLFHTRTAKTEKGGSVSEELVTKTLQVHTMGGATDTPGSPVLRPGTSSGHP